MSFAFDHLINLIINLQRRKMYFKEQQYSPLYLHYQKQDHNRHIKKIEEIKSRKQKQVSGGENVLPPIIHRPSQQKLHIKKLFLAETDRHNRRLNELKSHRSQYFQKIIGVNLVGEQSKLKKLSRTITNNSNMSALETTITQQPALKSK